MAFYEDDDEQQDPNQPATGQQTGAGGGLITGSGSGGSGSAPKAAPAPDNPGNFVGITQYLNANKPQAAKLGDQTAGVINQSADKARQGVAALQSEANDKIKGTNSLSDDVSNKIANGAEQLTAEERQQAKNTANATYTGPKAVTDLQGYQAAADAQNKAVQNIDQSGTEEGRMNLISQVNSKPRTQGMNIFDNALLQAGGGREKLTQAAQQNADVRSAVDQATQAIGGQIGRADDPSTPDVDESAGAIGQTNKAQADAYKKIQDALTGWQAAFEPKVQNARQDLIDRQSAVTGDIADNPYGLDQATMELLGLNEGDKLYGLDLNKYVNQASPNDITPANVADQTDYARYAALTDLAGVNPTLLNPADASKGGTAPTLSANQDLLKKDMADADAAYQAAYGGTRGGILKQDPNRTTSTSFAGTIPGALTGRRDIDTATPQEIEQFWIPLYRQAQAQFGGNGGYGFYADIFQKQLDDWKRSQLANNVVKRNQG